MDKLDHIIMALDCNWCHDSSDSSQCSVALVQHCPLSLNSLAPVKFLWHFWYLINIINQIVSVIDGWGISCELALNVNVTWAYWWQSTLVQVMACCHQATSHYLSQWWPRSLSPWYGITRPQWVNPFCFECISGNINMHLHFLSCLRT